MITSFVCARIITSVVHRPCMRTSGRAWTYVMASIEGWGVCINICYIPTSIAVRICVLLDLQTILVFVEEPEIRSRSVNLSPVAPELPYPDTVWHMPLTIWQQPTWQPTSYQGRPVLLASEECCCPGTPRILENREGRRPRPSVAVFSPTVTGTLTCVIQPSSVTFAMTPSKARSQASFISAVVNQGASFRKR
jgi:hypothetical protein